MSAIAVSLLATAPANAVVPNDNFTPADIVDNAGGVNGVGMFFRDDGSVCTGSLINPRTFLFAAHCVNDRPESDFATTVPAAASFDVNALPGFQSWLGNSFASNPDLFVYNLSQIVYHPDSLLRPEAQGFLEADIAIATLDTPANNIPTWALLFSPLPTPTIDPTTGTGYHVNITGYGRTGSGSVGDDTDIDWRRRAAENMLGALASADDRNAIFNSGSVLTQNLYRIDFDDPDQSNEFDFNLWRDEALTREATTAGGDSGGPLILDAANNSLSTEDLVIGVLSGGSKFDNSQEFSSYGTEAYYQPLYLFWDYVVANNPYRYASAQPGDGRWADRNHWITDLDPAYRIIDSNGNVVNGIPDDLGDGIAGDGPDFGEVCSIEGDPGDGCIDLATGNPVPASSPLVLPAATIENGLPGATVFVPNNIDPDPANGTPGRYFDVTLREAGRTRVSRSYTIDRLSLVGPAQLNINGRGDITVLGDFTQAGGILRVDGSLTTGEALIVDGLLRGRGTFDPTFLTLVGGSIQPGNSSVGTLTVMGGLILSSDTLSVFDLRHVGSDRIEVYGDADASGVISLGGTARFLHRSGSAPRDGTTQEIITAEDGIQGTYDEVVLGGLGVLVPELTYGANNVIISLTAGSLAENLSEDNAQASAFARGLDSLRSDNYDALYGLYGAIDVMDAARLTATLNNLAPTIVNEAQAVSVGQYDMMVDVVSDRLSMLGTGSLQSGTFSVVGAPEMLGVAASNANVSRATATQMSFAGRLVSNGRTLGTLPENVSGFISGGYEARSSATRFGSRSDNQANWHIAMGLEVELADNLTVGGASAFINGRTTLQGSQAQLMTNQAMVYASYQLGGGAYVAGLGSASVTDIETARYASGSLETARFGNETRALNYVGGMEAGITIGIADGFEVTPRTAMRYSHSEFGGYDEVGSEIALSIEDIREQRLEGRVGFAFSGDTTIGGGWSLRPQISADYVRAIGQSERDMTVRFAQAGGVPILLPGLAADNQWTEMRGGLSLERGNLSITTAFETDIGRSELRDDRAVAELSLRF
ncbi:autotransporter domain-containing protein [Parasphingopyxis sp. CP4]|uniref:autotransporter domain-containing protein n=1 Tax=Parasphingopyxis sp. CP4 TaxID=2724527 RepID=UPI00159FF739|nr:autotransporter domain-containing protein [Parasphingopyxis sp. CP4]QLC22373.1 autotransporter domain-containing protein [Parasphingopyxis sp. CP4]